MLDWEKGGKKKKSKMFDYEKRKRLQDVLLQVLILVILMIVNYCLGELFEYIKGSMNPVTMNFTVNSANIISNDHVGDDWGFSVKANGVRLEKLSSEIEVWEGKKLKIIFTATEHDDGEDDVGTYVFEKRLTEYDILYGIEISGNIVVRENNGRYAGNKAKIYVEAELNPILQNAKSEESLSNSEWMYEYEYDWFEAMYNSE